MGRGLRRQREPGSLSLPKVCFAPIWYPVEHYATSRLRAKYVVDLFACDRVWDVDINYNSDADIAVVVQLCSDRNFELISANRSQIVVYDICDRFFATDNVFKTDEGVLHARSRCREMIRRADVLITPTRRLQEEVTRLFPDTPCFYVPELVDYGASPRAATEVGSKRLVWFGHTTRGNFDTARWIIDALRSSHGYSPVLVTTPGTMMRRYPAYRDYCVPWSVEAVGRELAAAELCVVAHAANEPAKSANRFITATMHGVPTLVSGSPSCLELLDATGHRDFAVESASDIDRLVEILSNADRRAAYVRDLQEEMWRRHAPDVVRQAYLELFEKIWTDSSNY